MEKEKKKAKTDFLKHLKDSKDRQKKRERKAVLDDMINNVKYFTDNILKFTTIINGFGKDKQKQVKEKLDDKSRMYL